jgi:hypothetical protein
LHVLRAKESDPVVVCMSEQSDDTTVRDVVERSIEAARDAAERAERASDEDTEAFHTGIGAAHRGVVEEYGTEEDLEVI